MPKRKDLEPTKYPGISSTAGGHIVRARVRDPRTGMEVDTSRLVPGTIRQALIAQSEMRGEVRGRGQRARTKLSTYAASWLAKKAPELSIGTLERYRVALEQHFLPTFGRWYIDAITPDELVAWRDGAVAKAYAVVKRERDPKTRKLVERTEQRHYGPRSINGWIRIVRTLLADAYAELRLGVSPAARLRALPEPPAYTDAAPNVVSGDELARVLEALRDRSPGFYPLVMVMALTGMRTSEATALRWTDLEGTVITVQRSAVRGHVRERTKTGVARRVPITAELAAMLAVLRNEQTAQARIESRARGEVVQPAPWMFPSSKGEPRYGTTLAKPLRGALAAAGITRRLTPHGLRRTLNDLLRLVASSDVQKAITGHSSEAMRQHYSHVKIEERAGALGRVAAIIPIKPR